MVGRIVIIFQCITKRVGKKIFLDVQYYMIHDILINFIAFHWYLKCIRRQLKNLSNINIALRFILKLFPVTIIS